MLFAPDKKAQILLAQIILGVSIQNQAKKNLSQCSSAPSASDFPGDFGARKSGASSVLLLAASDS